MTLPLLEQVGRTAPASCGSPRPRGARGLSAQDAAALAAQLKALADPARLRLLALLQASDEGEVCVCDLTAPVGLSQPTVSHHLRVLLDAGLVTKAKRGTWAFYRVVPDRLAALASAISPAGRPDDEEATRERSGLAG